MSIDSPSPASSSLDIPSSYAISEASTSDMSYSLFINLASVRSGGFPATELIRYLIEAIGQDVSAFRRNAHVSYRLVDRIRDICNEINAHIKKVDEEDSWDSYEKFTAAIDPLEDLLFALNIISEDETQRYLADGGSVDKCITSTVNWETNREGLRSALTGLQGTKGIKELISDGDASADIARTAEAGKLDDVSFLGELIEFIREHCAEAATKTRGTVPTIIGDTYSGLKDMYAAIMDGQPTDLVVVLTIKSAILIHGVMEVYSDAATDEDWAWHLKSELVWQAASSLITHLHEASTELEGSENLALVQKEFDEFITKLRAIPGVELPESYTELMNYAGKIRRPYISQALALVSICRVLATKFEDTTYKVTKNIWPLEDAFYDTLAALEAAVEAVKELKFYDLSIFENNEAKTAFDDAATSLENCFDQFGLSDLWAANATRLTAAIKQDKDRLIQLNNKITARPIRDPNDTAGLIQVNVKVHDRTSTGRLIKETTLSVLGNTRLRAVRWHVSKALDAAESDRTLKASEFQKQGADQKYTARRLSDSVSELAEGQTCDLVLVLQ